MPSYYEAVGEEPTYGLAENIIRATTLNLKKDSKFYETYPTYSSYRENPIDFRFVSILPTDKHTARQTAF